MEARARRSGAAAAGTLDTGTGTMAGGITGTGATGAYSTGITGLGSDNLILGAGDLGVNLKDKEVVVRMVTLKANNVEMVMARNPSWERVIRIPLMQDGDQIHISTSHGGNITLNRSFMMEKAVKSHECLHELLMNIDDEHDHGSDHGTRGQHDSDKFAVCGVSGTAIGNGQGYGNVTHLDNKISSSSAALVSATNTTGTTAAATVTDNNTITTPNEKKMTSSSSTPLAAAGIRPGEDTTSSQPQQDIQSLLEGQGYYVIDVPVSNSDLPSSLKLCVTWIDDEVDNTSASSSQGCDSSTARRFSHNSRESHRNESEVTSTVMAAACSPRMSLWVIDVCRETLKHNGDNITLMIAIMTCAITIASIGSITVNNSLLYLFCMMLSGSVVGQALMRAVNVVDIERNLENNNSINSSSVGLSSVPNSGAYSFHLILVGHSFTSPEEPVMQTHDSIPERFIRACDGDMEQARKRWETTRHWRETEGVNTLLLEPQPHFHHIKNFYPHYNAGRGREGHIVYYERPGELMPQLKQLGMRGIEQKEMLRHWLFVTEFQFDILCDGDPLAKGISVIDVKGVGVTDFMGKTLDFVKKSIQVAGEHYPERSLVIYIVNANWVFTTIWAVIKLWIHENTAAKVRIVSPADTLKAMQEHIDISQIPEYYGGSLKCYHIAGEGYEGGELVENDKDSARFHCVESQSIYELVRRLNGHEIEAATDPCINGKVDGDSTVAVEPLRNVYNEFRPSGGDIMHNTTGPHRIGDSPGVLLPLIRNDNAKREAGGINRASDATVNNGSRSATGGGGGGGGGGVIGVNSTSTGDNDKSIGTSTPNTYSRAIQRGSGGSATNVNRRGTYSGKYTHQPGKILFPSNPNTAAGGGLQGTLGTITPDKKKSTNTDMFDTVSPLTTGSTSTSSPVYREVTRCLSDYDDVHY